MIHVVVELIKFTVVMMILIVAVATSGKEEKDETLE